MLPQSAFAGVFVAQNRGEVVHFHGLRQGVHPLFDVRAVSYTHLDVYKRQVVSRIEKKCHNGAIILAHPTQDTADALQEVINIVRAVSYTHLDVYKRQDIYYLCQLYATDVDF